MSYKIFVSYKYGDQAVCPLEEIEDTKVRDYVDILQDKLKDEHHINKGEADGEDLGDFKDSTIESKLRDKIYDSSVTIIVISKGMKDTALDESDQWIPWELSYSLKEHTRNGRTSQTNATLAVVLPDENNKYDYFITDNRCGDCACRTLYTDKLFKILRDNMFNQKNKEIMDCTSNKTVYKGHSSYIYSAKWEDFINDVNKYIDMSVDINSNIDDYNITKTV
ncbi:MAG: TIR domain-containing protein [Syntrophomonas sp.]